MAFTTQKVFKPTLNAGQIYARKLGSSEPMQSIGGIEELVLSIEENNIEQANFQTPGGGNRAKVNRISTVTASIKMQDINALNLSRAVFGSFSEVALGAVTNAAVTIQRGSLITLPHINPSAVVLKDDLNATIASSGNYEVRPEGIFILDDAPAAATPIAGTVSYSYPAHDVVEALTSGSPIIEMRFAGVNEAMSGAASVVDLFRVQVSAASNINLIGEEFLTLDVEGEVLLDPTKTGAGISKYFRQMMA